MKKNAFLVAALFILITLFFFYPIFKNEVPFPGDLLIGEYAPYNSYSYFGYGPGSYPNKGQDFDVIRLLYPAKEFSIESLKSGQIPLWNPYNFSGSPSLATLQGGTFYPINILFFIMPFLAAWTIYILLQPILAGIFTFFLLREYKLSKLSSFFGGIVFAFSSFMTVWVEYGNQDHPFIWLPLILFFITKNLKKVTVINSVLISIFLSCSILAGYIQGSFYVFVFSFLYTIFWVLFIDRKNWLKKLSLSIIIFIFPIFLTAVQFFPLIDLFGKSARNNYSSQTLITLLIPFKHLVTILVPDFFGNPATRNYFLNGTYIERVSYIGVIPLLFVFYNLLKKTSKLVIFYIFSVVVIFLLSYNTFISQFVYTYVKLPIISTGVPTRMMFLFSFSLSILSAFGFYEFEKGKSFKKLYIAVGIFVILFLSFWGYVLFATKILNISASNLLISKHNLILPTLICMSGIVLLFVGSLFHKYKKTILITVLALTIFDLFYFFQKITPFAPTASVYPSTAILQKLKKVEGIDRVWGYGSSHIDTNIQSHETIFSTEGYNALHLKDYGELLTIGKNGKIISPPPRSDVILEPGFGEDSLKNNHYRQTLLDILGVKYILNKTTQKTPDTIIFPEEKYKFLWQEGDYQVYQNKDALPRFFLTSSIKIEKGSQKKVDYLLQNPTSRTIVLSEKSQGSSSLKDDEKKTVKLISYNPNAVLFGTKSSENSMLFLSDSYDSGWKATVDGKYTKVLKADYAFRAVFVPKGQHKVEFIYQPISFTIGLIVTFASLIVLVLIVIFRKYIKI